MTVGLCAIAKNEGLYLREWIYYHLALGFDRIYIYDNDSEDHGCGDLCAETSLRRRIRVRPWPSISGVNAQASAYDDFFATFARSFEWILILDIDEFLVLKTHDTVDAFLKDYDFAAGVVINWKMFGSSGERHFERGLVTERFLRASDMHFEPNINVKSFFRPSAVHQASTHSPLFHDNAVVVDQLKRRIDTQASANILHRQVDYTNAQINHYFTKSYDEFVIKINRGKADVQIDDPNKYRRIEDFEAYDRNEETDRSILETLAFATLQSAMQDPKRAFPKPPRTPWQRALRLVRRP